MSFVSRHDGVFRKLIDRFQLQTAEREFVKVPSIIVPVTVVDDLVATMELAASSTSITGTGAYDIEKVPLGKRWTLSALDAHLSSGTWTISGFGLVDPGGTVVWIELPASALTLTWSSHPIILDEGWSIRIEIDTWSVTGTLGMVAMHRECDI